VSDMNIQQFTIRLLDEKIGILEKRYATVRHRIEYWRQHLRSSRGWSLQLFQERSDSYKKDRDRICVELKEYRIRKVELKEYFKEN